MEGNRELARSLSEAVGRAINEALLGTQHAEQPQVQQSQPARQISTPPSNHSSRRAGRLRKVVCKETLQNLLKLKIPICDIASQMQVSRPVIYKAIAEYGIEYKRFSETSEHDLHEYVVAIKEKHPNSGEVMVQGHLAAQEIHVQRSRLREVIRAVDPDGVAARKRPAIKRRVYSVPCPNYMWHIDGNHKLIRWRLVLHHAVDGFSRLVVFAHCSPNNRAETVCQLYRESVARYGRPFRVRTDHGGENADIWYDMINFWGEDARPVVVGSSVHNQRVERHNRAANEQELSLFRREFYELEEEGILDPLNDTDIFALQFVYLPRINRNISEFVAAHNNHKVSTEGNNTPAQLFWVNLHLTAGYEGRPTDAWQGINVNHLLSTQLPHVTVPETPNPLDEAAFSELKALVDPLSGAGKELYRQTIQFIARSMLS